MKKLKLAVCNGTMEQQMVNYLEQAGLRFQKEPRRFRYVIGHDLVSEVVFMRPQDMPREVAHGNYDMGICGFDFFLEYGSSIDHNSDKQTPGCGMHGSFDTSKAGAHSTKVVLIAHKDDPASSKADVPKGAKILSEYPWLTREVLSPNKVEGSDLWTYDLNRNAHPGVVYSCGATEAHIPWNYRFGVCLVASGLTLAANNLKIVDVLCETCPVMLHAGQDKQKEQRQLRHLFAEAGLLRLGLL